MKKRTQDLTIEDIEAEIVEALKKIRKGGASSPTLTAVFKKVSGDKVRFDVALDALLSAGTVEMYQNEVKSRTWIRLADSGTEWAISAADRCMDFIRAENRAGRVPRNVDIRRALKISIPTARNTVRALTRSGRVVTVINGPRDIPLYICLVANEKEFSGLLNAYPRHISPSVKKKNRTAVMPDEDTPAEDDIPADFKLTPKIINVGTGLLPADIWEAKQKTLPGDIIKTSIGERVVTFCAPNLCVLGDYSVKWSDMALYYRNRHPIPITRRLES